MKHSEANTDHFTASECCAASTSVVIDLPLVLAGFTIAKLKFLVSSYSENDKTINKEAVRF